MLKECLILQRCKLGDSHPDVLNTIHNLANTYDDQEKYEEAIKLYQECVDARKGLLGDDDECTIEAMKGLARVQTIMNFKKLKLN